MFSPRRSLVFVRQIDCRSSTKRRSEQARTHLQQKMRAPLFRDAPGTPERPSGHRRDGGESSRNSSWLSGRSARNTAAVMVVLLLLLAAVGQFGTEREWNAGLREMVRARVESAGVASAVRRVQTLEEISDGMAHRGEGGMRSVAGGERTGRESAPPPPRVFDIKLRGEETEGRRRRRRRW